MTDQSRYFAILAIYVYFSSVIVASYTIGQAASGENMFAGLLLAFIWPLAWPFFIVIGLVA